MNPASVRDQRRSYPWLIYLSTGLAALVLKTHYSRATVDALAWILEPTAKAVGWLHHQPLLHDANLGWQAADGSFVIAPACAGVNFLIVTLGVSVCGFVHRFRSPLQRCVWFVLMSGNTYLLTIAVNTLRIVAAVALYQADISAGWLTPERVHRLAGTLIYLAGLCAAWVGCDAISARLGRAPARAPTYMLPAAYLGWTVVLPLLNGAWRRSGTHYLEHALTVTLIAAAIVPLLSRIRRASTNVVLSKPGKGGAAKSGPK